MGKGNVDYDAELTAQSAANLHAAAHFSQNEFYDDGQVLSVVVPVKIRVDGQNLSLISMVAQFDAVQELTYSGVHMGLFFPEDEITEAYFKSLAL